jgi:hypothetical protein
VNEKQIKALIKEAEAAAKRYKAELNAKSKTSTPKTTKAPKATAPKAPRGGMRGGGAGGGGLINPKTR